MSRSNYKFIVLVISLFLFPFSAFPQICPNLSDLEVKQIIADLKAKKFSVSELDACQKRSYKLFSDLIKVNPNYFKYASLTLRNDAVFIKGFVKSDPQILDNISLNLKSDPLFFKSVIKLYDKALEYANYDLVDNYDFMALMIDSNPNNFIYASSRLQDNKDLVLVAVKKDGRMIKYASARLISDKEIIAEAKKTYSLTQDDHDKDSKETLKTAKESNKYDFLNNADIFLMDNYGGIGVGPSGLRGYRIVNQVKNLDRDPVIDRKDFFKWKYFWNNKANAKLITGKFKELSWKTDLRNQPNLILTIEDFLKKQEVDQNTINAMTLTSLWRISDKPEIVIFKIYLLRNSKNIYNQVNLNNTYYLVGIAVGNKPKITADIKKEGDAIKSDNLIESEEIKEEDLQDIKEGDGDLKMQENQGEIKDEAKIEDDSTKEKDNSVKIEDDSSKVENGDKIEGDSSEKTPESKEEKDKKKPKFDNKIIDQEMWILTIIDSNLDIDLEDNIILKNNHKEYDFWDIYQDKEDRFSNLIFRVQDQNEEYFEFFSKQGDNIYRSIFKGGGYSFD